MFLLFMLNMALAFSALQVKCSSVHMTVLVHGTHPARKVLAHPKSPFRRLIYAEPGLHLAKELPKKYYFSKVARSCSEFDQTKYSLDHFYTYGWNSSNLKPMHRYQTGKMLYQAINEQCIAYKTQGFDKIYIQLIGVSHGGNVVLNALQFLPFVDQNVDLEVVLFGTPIQEHTRKFINNSYVARAYSFYSTSDYMQKIDAQRFHKDSPKGVPFFSQRTFLQDDCVMQIQLLVDGAAFHHGKYRPLMLYLPLILQQAEQILCNKAGAHIVMNIDLPK